MGNDREVVEGQVFKISYTYNSSVGTYTYVKNYDEKYLEKVRFTSRYNGSKGMTGCSTKEYAYFKAKKHGSTKIILGHEYRGTKTGNTSIKVKIKKNDGKTPIENIVEEEEEEDEPRQEIPKKICIIGDSKVGKTSLIRFFNGESFNDIYEPTQNNDLIKKKINYKNKEIELYIWDITGNEKFRIINKLFYKNSSIIIFVYDITNKNSFENIKNYLYNDVQTNIDTKPMMVILGNKSDLYDAEEVNEEEAIEYAKSIKSKFKIVSAKDGCGLNNFIEELIKDYPNSK